MTVTHASRTAAARARLFVQLAADCHADKRVEFEAFVEASIVFARAALHRLQTRHRRHPQWQSWWSALATNPSVEFFRKQRDWVLKEAPPRIGQRGFVGCAGSSNPGHTPTLADEFYFFESAAVSATSTLFAHLQEIERLLAEAEILLA